MNHHIDEFLISNQKEEKKRTTFQFHKPNRSQLFSIHSVFMLDLSFERSGNNCYRCLIPPNVECYLWSPDTFFIQFKRMTMVTGIGLENIGLRIDSHNNGYILYFDYTKLKGDKKRNWCFNIYHFITLYFVQCKFNCKFRMPNVCVWDVRCFQSVWPAGHNNLCWNGNFQKYSI